MSELFTKTRVDNYKRLWLLKYLVGLAMLIMGTLSLSGAANAQVNSGVNKDDTIIYLVRHAEKGKRKSNDCEKTPLTVEGQIRALLLADILRNEKIHEIHSTKCARTIATAQPLADILDKEIEIYAKSNSPTNQELKLLKGKLTAGNHYLVVGHSNSLLSTVNTLGGDGGDKILSMEFDRLYVVRIDKNGKVATKHRHYGTRF